MFAFFVDFSVGTSSEGSVLERCVDWICRARAHPSRPNPSIKVPSRSNEDDSGVTNINSKESTFPSVKCASSASCIPPVATILGAAANARRIGSGFALGREDRHLHLR